MELLAVTAPPEALPHDGLMYFAHGSVSQAGVVLPQGFTVELAPARM